MTVIAMDEEVKEEVYEPEVIPPRGSPAEERVRKASAPKRFERAFGPILGGAVIDFMDLATFGPAGFILGAAIGFWICSIYRLPMPQRIVLSLLAGAYCMMPFTRFLPLATLIGAYVRFRGTENHGGTETTEKRETTNRHR